MKPNSALPFDRALKRRHLARAAAGFARHDFLYREVTTRLVDRVLDVKRAFPRALDLGGRGDMVASALAGRAGVATLVHAAPAAGLLGSAGVVADEEWLPFAPASFDLVLAPLSLTWVNDLPGTLLQIARILQPDGLLLAGLPGGRTLTELRQALLRAEAEVEGGASPRVAPFLDMRDGAGLLQRAGFALPVADSEIITVTYADPLALLRELRGAGETAALTERRGSLRRSTLLRAMQIYAEMFATPDGRVPATFELVTLTGWAPHAAQPKPLKPGSAKARLAEALGTEERPAGEKAGR
ncbi:methyltransferase domain-containing protein [Desertibaculum subflavum]|uniref:methyltransferase domain-containing protein n=1 Tax=Desertibaculum subflavum TaxID=2268458 RepID=UPI0034D31E88